MSNPETDKVFTGSIPKLYDTYLLPLIFEQYAADVANRLASRPLSRVLEIVAGTGVVTRALASALYALLLGRSEPRRDISHEARDDQSTFS